MMVCLRNCALPDNRAFTLIELMVAFAAASVFIIATLTIADICIRTYGAQERVSDAQQSVRAALDLMTRDIRMAGYDPKAGSHGPTDGIGILAATETMLQFSSDLNADRFDSGGMENLTYFYDAAKRRLRQKEGGKAYPQTFIENVSTLNFGYLDPDGNPADRRDQIAMVMITLTVEEKGLKGSVFRRTLTTCVNCRNLRL